MDPKRISPRRSPQAPGADKETTRRDSTALTRLKSTRYIAENVALGIVLGLALAHVAVAWIDASMGIELGFIAEHPRMTCRGLSVVIGDDGYPSRCGGDSK